MVVDLASLVVPGTVYQVALSYDTNLQLSIRGGPQLLQTTFFEPTLIQGYLAAELVSKAIAKEAGKPTAPVNIETLNNYVRIVGEWYQSCVIDKKFFRTINQGQYGIYFPQGIEISQEIEDILEQTALDAVNSILTLTAQYQVPFSSEEILCFLGENTTEGPRLLLAGSLIWGSKPSFDALRYVSEHTDVKTILSVASNRYGNTLAERLKNQEYVAGVESSLSELLQVAGNLEIITPEETKTTLVVRSINLFIKSKVKQTLPEGAIELLEKIFLSTERNTTNLNLKQYCALLRTNLTAGLMYYCLMNHGDPDHSTQHRPYSLRQLQFELGMKHSEVSRLSLERKQLPLLPIPLSSSPIVPQVAPPVVSALTKEVVSPPNMPPETNTTPKWGVVRSRRESVAPPELAPPTISFFESERDDALRGLLQGFLEEDLGDNLPRDGTGNDGTGNNSPKNLAETLIQGRLEPKAKPISSPPIPGLAIFKRKKDK